MLLACRDEPTPADAARELTTYTGSAACAECHPREAEAWRGSHHDLAMQVADDSSVLADFEDAAFTYAGTTSRFFRRDGRFLVRTDGPDGALRDYEIAYTFGVDPLQQYLIRFPRGRVQALGVAWDTRPREQGGQRWFHLYPDEAIAHGDVLHWTGLNQNWNAMCAECHSRATGWTRTPTRRRGQRSMSRARRATVRARRTSAGKRRRRAGRRATRIQTEASWSASGNARAGSSIRAP
jgi:hypothetical protein